MNRSDDQREVRLAELLAEALPELRAGGPVQTTSYQTRYPDLAKDLLPLMGTMADLDRAAASWKDVRFPPDAAPSTIGRAGAADPFPTLGDPAAGPAENPTQPSPPAGNFPGPTRSVPETIGRYQLLERLGVGGMGKVYKAYDPQLRRWVALKVPRFDGPEEHQTLGQQRFLREARSAALIRHAHVCPIYDVGEHQGMPYVVMAYVEGQSLAARLAGDRRFEDLQEAAALVRQVAEALEAVHAHGIIHRDLKPGNILLDRAGQVLLTDFGLARQADDSEHLTAEGMLLGTPAFMAPEQAACETARIGPWTDLYSLGVVFYRMITGRLPFEGPTHALIFKIVYETPPPPSRFRKGLDPALDAILCKALARLPQERYQSAREFAEALEQWSKGTARGPRLPNQADAPRVAGKEASLQGSPVAGSPLTPGVSGGGRFPGTPVQSELPNEGFPWGTIHPSETPAGQIITPVPRKPPGKRRGRPPVAICLALALLMAGGLIYLGIALVFHDTPDPVKKDGPPRTDAPKDGSNPAPPKRERVPRRALVISVSNYLYANPLNYGGTNANTGDLVKTLHRHWHFPNSEMVELGDGAALARPQAPRKRVIEQTVTGFLDSSQPADTIVVLFAGHAVELDKQAYLVPVEGDLGDSKTLIPLAWLYDKLAKGPGREKVLILDVCRFDPDRGQERPSPGPMGAVLDAALQKPPAAVQVWSSCVAGQQSYESAQGSLFLRALCHSLADKSLTRISKSTKPLPLDLWHGKVSAFITTALKEWHLSQTPRLTSAESSDPAGRGAIQSILDEIETIPPAKVMAALRTERLKFEVLPRFSARTMKQYRADYPSLQELDRKLRDNPRDFPLIRAVRQATRVLEENAQAFSETLIGQKFPLPPQEKTRLMRYQTKVVASMISKLQDALEALKEAGTGLDQEESKRWQANYEFVLAKLLARLIFVHEYSLMLAMARKDNLPLLKPGQTGWRLASAPKMQNRELHIKKLLRDRKAALDSLMKKHPGTPWEVLARREGVTNLGLEWQPFGSQ
jgi:serine/threonine protein kinase